MPAKKRSTVFSNEEKAAMREAVRDRTRGRLSAADGEAEVRAKIAAMKGQDRVLAQRVHDLIRAAVPELTCRTWYGMPAYKKGDEIVCYFQESGKFKARYSTLGFSDKAKLDEGRMWPVVYALTELTPADEARITALVKRAAGPSTL